MSTTHKPPSSRRNIKALECRRLKAALFFRKKLKHAEIARRLRVSRAAIHQWYVVWKQRGRQGLLAPGRLGRKPNLTKRDVARIRKELLKGPRHAGYATEFWNLDRIATVIRQVASVSYHPGHVWKVLLRMGWSCQAPETRAKERDEKAIKHWVEVSWPRIQKRG